MPTWLTIQMGLLSVWMVIGFIVYETEAWRVGFPFGRKGFKALVVRVMTIGWLLSSIVVGLIYPGIAYASGIAFETFIGLTIVPGLVLVSLWIMSRFSAKQSESMNRSVDALRNDCVRWVRNFAFVGTNNFEVEGRTYQGEATCRITIWDVSLEEKELLTKAADEELPSSVALMVIVRE